MRQGELHKIPERLHVARDDSWFERRPMTTTKHVKKQNADDRLCELRSLNAFPSTLFLNGRSGGDEVF